MSRYRISHVKSDSNYIPIVICDNLASSLFLVDKLKSFIPDSDFIVLQVESPFNRNEFINPSFYTRSGRLTNVKARRVSCLAQFFA